MRHPGRLCQWSREWCFSWSPRYMVVVAFVAPPAPGPWPASDRSVRSGHPSGGDGRKRVVITCCSRVVTLSADVGGDPMDGLRPGDGPERLTISDRPGSASARVQDHQRPHHPGRRGAGRAVRLLLGATLLAAGWVVLTSTGSQAAETHGRTLGGLTRALGPVSAPVRQVLGGAGAATAGPSQHPAGPSHRVVRLEPVRRIVRAVTAPAAPDVRPVIAALPTVTGRVLPALPALTLPPPPRPALLSALTIPVPVASQVGRSVRPFGPPARATRATPPGLTTLAPAARRSPEPSRLRPGPPGPSRPVARAGPAGPVPARSRTRPAWSARSARSRARPVTAPVRPRPRSPCWLSPVAPGRSGGDCPASAGRRRSLLARAPARPDRARPAQLPARPAAATAAPHPLSGEHP